MLEFFSLLVLGFVFGIKHAFEADHIAAVSVLNSDSHTPRQAIICAAYWGFGHTLTLFLTGAAVLILKINMPARFGEFFDRAIAIMLILLGARALVIFFKSRNITNSGAVMHSHPPLGSHVHAAPSLSVRLGDGKARPVGSLFVGMIHGLAGSAAVLVLAVSIMKSAVLGLIYIAIFGLGSTLGMCIFSIALGFSFNRLQKTASLLAGLFSVGAGVALFIAQ